MNDPNMNHNFWGGDYEYDDEDRHDDHENVSINSMAGKKLKSKFL